MASKVNVENFFGHYKYLVTIVIGIAFIGFISESSLLNIYKINTEKKDLKQEIDKLRAQYKQDEYQLRELQHSKYMVEKIARERYFMKKSDEDIFILSSDQRRQQEKEAAENKNKKENEETE